MQHLRENTKTPLAPSDGHFLSDATLLRFTRARDCKPAKALEMLEACLAWRLDYRPQSIKQDEIEDIQQLGTVFVSGFCRNGYPVLYMTPGAKNPFDADHRVKLMVFLMEETLRRGYERLTWVFDFSKMGERGKDEESSKTRQQVIKILQDYYPERLGALYMVNTPWYFSVVATLVWPFIDKRTRVKLHIGVKVEDLKKFIDPAMLIEHLGGEHKVDLTCVDLLPPHPQQEE